MLRVDRFLWAACQLDVLETCLNYHTLQIALASLPKTLDEIYASIWRGIPFEHKQIATRILQFLAFSERPLTIEEAVDAIAVHTEGNKYFKQEDRLPDLRQITRFWTSLVVVAPSRDDDEHVELQLAHISVKEYLTSDRLDKDMSQNFQEVTVKASMAKVCLAYLLSLPSGLSDREIRQRFPFSQYSAMYWMAYATVAEGTDATLQDLIREFFCNQWACRNCYRLYLPDRSSGDVPEMEENDPVPVLYYASFGGLIDAVNYLLRLGYDVDARGEYYGFELQAASVGGHEKVVELLLGKGADVNALQAASREGHEKVAELLGKAES